jgi:hypothetical protein
MKDVKRAIQAGCDHAPGAEDPACDACRARALAAGIWREERDRDEAGAREAAERALLARWPPAPRRWVGNVVAACAVAAVGMLAVDLGMRRAATGESPAVASGSAQVDASPGAGIASASARTSAPGVVPAGSGARPHAPAVVAAAECRRCAWQVPAAPGVALPQGERVDVPAGEHLLLGWAIDRGLVDPGEGVDVDGPADVRLDAGDGGGDAQTALVVERGRAHVRAKTERAVGGALGTSWGADAEWTIEQRPDRMRVAVAQGEVFLSRAGEAPVVVGSGRTVDVLRDGRTVDAADTGGEPTGATASVLAAGPSPMAAATPVNAAPGGDAAGDRASFLQAELDLKAGRVDKARDRLEPLLRSHDAPLAGDAAYVLAQAAATPAARADVLARYLATDPPDPYRSQATAERARALCEAGDPAAARALLAHVGGGDLPTVTRGAVARARACLAPSP